MMTYGLRRFAAVLLIMLSTHVAQAQNAGNGGGDEISVYAGSMLPNHIKGVTEILPLFGVRYGLRTGGFSTWEFALTNSHAEGVDFTTMSGSYRYDLPTVDQFTGFLYGGIDAHWYRPIYESERKSDVGLHIGAGLLLHISDNFSLRGDMKFSGTPGTSLSFLIGASVGL